METLLTLKETAKLLKTTERGLRKRIWNDEVPARKLGRKIVFFQSELEKFIQNLPPRWPKQKENKT